MQSLNKYLFFALRLSLGWFFFYAGITKVLDPNWSAAGYLNNAHTFSSFYSWLAGADILPFINFLNAWGLTLIGVSLLVGLFVRLSAVLGATMMLFYYFPALQFPQVGTHAFIINDHIIYALALLLLASAQAGGFWGLDKYIGLKNKKDRLFGLFNK